MTFIVMLDGTGWNVTSETGEIGHLAPGDFILHEYEVDEQKYLAYLSIQKKPPVLDEYPASGVWKEMVTPMGDGSQIGPYLVMTDDRGAPIFVILSNSLTEDEAHTMRHHLDALRDAAWK